MGHFFFRRDQSIKLQSENTTKSETVVFGLRLKFKTLVSAKDKVTQLYLQTGPSGTLS